VDDATPVRLREQEQLAFEQRPVERSRAKTRLASRSGRSDMRQGYNRASTTVIGRPRGGLRCATIASS